MAVILKRIVAVLVSIFWLSLIVVLLAGTFVPGFREALPPQVREFTDPDELRELLRNLSDSLPGDLGALIPTVPEATATPTSAAAVTAPPTATRVSATPTAAPPTTAPATPSPTPTLDAEEDVQQVVEAVPVAVAVSVQAELRTVPSEEADVIGLVAIGGTVFIDGRDAAGNWYRLEDGTWISVDALVEAPAEQVPVVTAETQQTITEVESQPTQTEIPAATPIVQLEAAQAFVSLDANLRSGPGTDFERVDGVFAGDEVSVVGQSADGEWYLLEGGAWLFAALVVEAVDVPVISEDGVAVQPAEGDEEQAEGDEEQAEGDEEQTGVDEEQAEGDEEQAGVDEQQANVDEEQAEGDEEQADDDELQPTSFVNAPLGANLRSGPGVQFERVEGIQQGASLTVVAQDASGDWLKLDSGLWIFAALVDDVPEDLPVDTGEETSTEADDAGEEDEALEEASALDEEEDEAPEETPALDEEDGADNGETDGTQSPDESEDEQGEQTEDEEQAESATVNTDANLRNGPGLEATIVAMVLAGTEVTVIGRSEDEQWLELGDGHWIFAALVDFAEIEEEGEEEAGAEDGNAAEDGNGTEETSEDDEEEGNSGAQG